LQTLNEYSQSNTFAERFNNILDTIDDLEVPYNLKSLITQLINDNEAEIAEHQYESLVSDYEDYEYEKHKEEKYFKDDEWKKIYQKTNILLIQKK